MSAPRLQAFLDGQSELGSGPDPPPRATEEGCLKRAWQRFKTRVNRLQDIVGQLLPSPTNDARELWRQLRQHLGSLAQILIRLARLSKASLLGDYRCLRLPQ